MAASLLSYEASAGQPLQGPLRDTRVVIQPCFAVQGWPLSTGGSSPRPWSSDSEAVVIGHLRRSGAQLVGASHMSEMAFGINRDTTADVLTTGRADIALMSDTLGEARLAGGSAGLWAFKPSNGHVADHGMLRLAPSLSTCALMAADIGILEAGFRAITANGPKPAESAPAPASFRLVFLREALAHLTPSEKASFEARLEALGRTGIRLEEATLPDFHLFPKCHQVIGSVEAAASARRYNGSNSGFRPPAADTTLRFFMKPCAESFGVPLKTYMFQGAYLQFENQPAVEAAHRLRRRLTLAMKACCAPYDAIVSPVVRADDAAAKACDLEGLYHAFLFCLFPNLTGQPSMVWPDHTQQPAPGVPLLLTAAAGQDDRLLALARCLASA